jgi:hypothetical protein
MSLSGLFSNAPQLQGAQTIADYIRQAQQQAMPYYLQGVDTLRQYGGAGLNTLQNNLQQIQPGVDRLKTLLGLGPDGMEGALTALRGRPGYQFGLQQGNAEINANAQRTGDTGGNLDLALNKFGQNYADQTYNSAISELQPFLTGLQNVGGQVANTATNLGGQISGGLQGIGNALYGGTTSAGNALAAAQSNTSGAANLFNGLLGGASALLGGGGGLFSSLGSGLMSLSDIKLKEDVEPVGKLYDGTNVYRYRYRGSPRTEIGLIAQEVEQTTPEAVVEFLPDLRAVDYRRATERAAKIIELSRERGEPTPTHRPFAAELMELAA